MEKKTKDVTVHENVRVSEVESQETDQKKGKFGIKHGLLMMLCCLLPIIIIGLLPIIGFQSFSWSWAFFLLCPLMHVGMMFFMKDHH